jgi:hypothetical protein
VATPRLHEAVHLLHAAFWRVQVPLVRLSTDQMDWHCNLDAGNGLQQKKEARQSSITPPATLPEGCDPWQGSGKAPQLQAVDTDVKMPSRGG